MTAIRDAFALTTWEQDSFAYADSHSDLPLLRAVGNPVAVNPDVALYRVARRHRWPVESWKRANGTPRVLVSEGVGS